MLRVTPQDRFKMTGFVTELNAPVTKYEEICPVFASFAKQRRLRPEVRHLSETAAVTAEADEEVEHLTHRV
jgi:hypothetical protein